MSEIDKIVDFVIANSPYTDREIIKEYINIHLGYGTCDYAFNGNGKVAYVCRWNIENRTAVILDLIISKRFRRKGLIKKILQKNLDRFPFVHFLSWKRGNKYPNRKPRIYSVREIL